MLEQEQEVYLLITLPVRTVQTHLCHLTHPIRHSGIELSLKQQLCKDLENVHVIPFLVFII